MMISPLAAPRIADPVPPQPPSGSAVYRAYSSDLFAIPGVSSVGWSKSAPDEVRVSFVTDGFRRLADNVLRDAIDGVRLVLVNAESAPPPVPGADPWADNPTEMVRVVRGLPGIVDGSMESEHGVRSAGFLAASKDVAAHLKALVNPSFDVWGTYFWTRGPGA